MADPTQPEVADSKSPSSTPKEPKRDPWDPILLSHDSFLHNLECIGEMVDLVLPVLANKDKERVRRIEELVKEMKEMEDGDSLQMKSAPDFREIMGHVRRIRRGDMMFRQGVITSIVSKFDEFLIAVLKTAYRQNAGWLKNPDKKMSYKDLLEIASFDSLKDEIIAGEIDAIMRDSHYSQIMFLDSKLKLGVQKGFAGWLEFLEITERRNLFVHTGGVVSTQYVENCAKWNIVLDGGVKEGVRLLAPDAYIRRAIDCFYELSVRVAQASVRRMFPDSYAEADRRLNDRSLELLVEQRWELGDRVFAFAMDIPEDMKSGGELKYCFLLNRCIAMKFSGKSFQKDLHSVDWGPFHPKYHLAVAVLEDRFDGAEKLMRSEAVRSAVAERDFRQWPLFREFRKTSAFLKTYKDVFGKDYNEQLLVDAAKQFEAQQGVDSTILPPPLSSRDSG